MAKTAIVPGSFDPITKGHLDIITRTSGIFDEVYVLVADNDGKDNLFSSEERIEFVRDAILELPNVKVDSYKGMTIDYFSKVNAVAIVRGIRDERDTAVEEEYDYYNRSFNKDVNTLLLFSSEEFKHLSSSALKTLIINDIDISQYVTEKVYLALKEKYHK